MCQLSRACFSEICEELILTVGLSRFLENCFSNELILMYGEMILRG